MFRNILKLFIAAGLFLLIISCDSPVKDEDITFAEWTEHYIENAVSDNHLKGGVSVVVYFRGKVIHSGGSGWADRENRWEMDGDTPMPVGSISKIFTSVAVMKLVEEGRIDLDEPVGNYLKRLELEDDQQMAFSVRDLLTHHSGIPGDLFENWFDNDKELLYEMLKNRPMAAEPGKLFSYANIGFSLLGLIIEEVSGTTFEEYVRSEIFVPAGMEHSYVYPGEAREVLPRGYLKKSDIPVPQLRDIPAGGFVISANDMGLFFDALYGREPLLLDESALKEMLTVQNKDNIYDRNFRIGLGFWLIDPFGSGALTASHGGDLPPFHSVMITFPDSDSAVFVAANDHKKDGSVAILAGIDIAGELLKRAGYTLPEKSPASFVTSTSEEQDLLTGTYGTMAGLVEIGPSGEAFQMILGRKKLYFAKKDNGMYTAQFRLFNRITIPVPQLEMMEFDMYEAGGDMWMGLWMKGVYLGTASRLAPVRYGEEFAQFTGSYADPGEENILADDSRAISDIEIYYRNGRYIMSLNLLGQSLEMALRPDGPERALTDGQGRGMGDLLVFERDGDKVFLYWSGFALRKN